MNEINTKRKNNDIQKLFEMFKILNDLTVNTSNFNLIEILINIGELAGEISFNNKDSECIRNKYGYIQRIKIRRKLNNTEIEETGMKINDDGIDFKKLSYLKQTLTTLSDNEKELAFIDYEEKQSIIQALYNLQIKIAHVLCEENGLFPSNADLEKQIKILKSNYNPKEHHILNIIQFSSKHYQQIVFKRIKEEFTSFENVDLNFKDDLYYFGRKFTIIGELLHEINEDRTIQMNYKLQNAFKNLNNTRDLLIHHHKQVDDYKENKEEIEKLVINIKTDFLKIIISEGKNVFRLNNDDLQIANSLKMNSEKLNEFIKNSKTKEKSSVSNINLTDSIATHSIKLLNKFKNLIILVADTLKSQNPEKTWDILNKSFQNINRQLTIKSRPYSEENMQTLMKNIETYVKEIKTKLTGDLTIYYQGDIKKLSKDLQIIYFIEALSENDKQVIINFGDELSKKRKQENCEKKKKIDEENKNREQNKIRWVIQDILRNIHFEIDYLNEIEQRKLTNNKQDYIMDHIVSIIGQYQRDLNDAYNKLLKLDDNLISPIPTSICLGASVSSKKARSYELVHNIFSLDRESLCNRIKEDILPAQNHFYYIFKIYEYESFKSVPRSVQTYYNLGVCYLSLHMTNEAIVYLEQGIKMLEEMNTKEQYLLQYVICSGENKFCVHSHLNTSDYDISSLFMYLYINLILSLCYKLIENNDKAYEILKPIYEQIKSIKDLENFCDNCYSLVYSICNNITLDLYNIYYSNSNQNDNDYEDALRVLEKLSKNDFRSKIHLMIAYTQLNKYKQAIEIIESFLKDPNLSLIYKFQVLIHKHELLEKNSNDVEYVNKTKEILSELNEIKKFENEFKEHCGDDYVAIDLFIITIKLELIFRHIQVIGHEPCEIHPEILKLEIIQLEIELNNLSKFFKIITTVISEHFRKIYQYYTLIICGMIFTDKKEFEEKIENAKDYFSKLQILDKHKNAYYLAVAYKNYAIKYIPQTEFEERLKYKQNALDIIKQYEPENDLNFELLMDLGAEHYVLGGKCISCNNPEDALKNYNKSINYFQQIEHDLNIDLSKKCTLYNGLATVYEKIAIINWKSDSESLLIAQLYFEETEKLISILIKQKKDTPEEVNNNEKIQILEELKYETACKKENCKRRQLSDNFEYELILIDAYIESDKLLEANNSISNILNISKNPLVMYRALKLKFKLIKKTIKDPNEFINEIKEMLLQLDLLIKDIKKEGTKTDDDYILINLFIIYLKLDSFNENLILIKENQTNCIEKNLKPELFQIEDEFNYLISKINIISTCIDDQLKNVFNQFTWCFSRMTNITSSENEFDELFKKTNDYFNKLKTFKSTYAYYLALNCANFAEKQVNSEKYIKYLKQGLDIVKQYKTDPNNNDLVINLSIDLATEHHKLGNSCLKPENALDNYNKSIKYLQQIEHDSNIEFRRKCNIYTVLASCYKDKGINTQNVESILEALLYCEKVTELLNLKIIYQKTNRNNVIKKLLEQKGAIEICKQECAWYLLLSWRSKKKI